MDVLSLIGRDAPLFDEDLTQHREALAERVAGGRFLVIGGAGTIGQAVVREIFRRNPAEYDAGKLDHFLQAIQDLRAAGRWEKGDLVRLFHDMVPEFAHKETGRYLDGRM